MSVKKQPFKAVPHADSLPNGGNTPEKKTNKRRPVTPSNKPTKLEIRRRDYDTMKSNNIGEMKQRHAIDNGGFTRPGSHK